MKGLSCDVCRSRKVLCDRAEPECRRCVVAGKHCHYPSRKRRSTQQVPKQNVQELEQRLAKVEAQLAINRGLRHSTEAHSPSNDSTWDSEDDVQRKASQGSCPSLNKVTYSNPTELMQSFGTRTNFSMRSGIPTATEMELTQIYFNTIHAAAPFLHPSQFTTMIQQGTLTAAFVALKFAVWALAALKSPSYHGLAEGFYTRSRQIVEGIESKDNDDEMMLISLTQTWYLIAWFEATQFYLPKAWFSVGRCVRFSYYQCLHMVDAQDDDPTPSTSIDSRRKREERRRTFWASYQADIWASNMANRMAVFNDVDIITRLPCSEVAFENDFADPTPFLSEMFLAKSVIGLSPFAVTAFISAILRRCRTLISPNRNLESKVRQTLSADNDYQALDTLISTLFISLSSEVIKASAISSDKTLQFCYIDLHCVNILLHHAALDQAMKCTEDQHIILRSFHRCLVSAQAVRNTVATMNNFQSLPFSIWTGYCLSVAADIFVQDSVSIHVSTKSTADLGLLLVVLKLMKTKFADSFANSLEKRIFDAGLQRLVYHTLQQIT